MSGLEELKRGSFDEKDKEKLVEFLNFISENAEFNLGVKEVVSFFNLLSWAQNVLLKKINENIMGTPKVIEPEAETEPKKSGKKK